MTMLLVLIFMVLITTFSFTEIMYFAVTHHGNIKFLCDINLFLL